MRYGEERLDLSSFPIEKEIKGSKPLGCILTGFSALWGGIPTFVLISSLISGEFEPAMFMILIFTVIGSILFLVGLNQFFTKGHMTITESAVSYYKKSLFGIKEWTEDYSAYKGVMYRSEWHSGGKNQSSYTLYIVELYHEEKNKTVKLFSSRSDGEVRKYWEDSARILRKPAIEKSEDGFVEREIEDLDKSVKELVQEKKIEVDFDPRSTPPQGLTVEVQEGVMCVTLDKKPIPLLASLFMIGFPCIFIGVGIFADGPGLVFAIVGILFLLLMLAIIVGSYVARRQIQLTSDKVRTVFITPWGEKMPMEISTDTIEQVEIQENPQSRKKEIVLKSDTSQMTVGQSLSPEAQEWLKNCILAVIAAG